MWNNKSEGENDNDEDLDQILDLDTDLIKNNINTYSSEKLCEMIVCDRYLNFGQEISLFCMEELVKRRINGDGFNYEEYINKSLKDLPEINMKLPDIKSILEQIVGENKK